MDIRELKRSELEWLLELYTHLHDADDPLPPPQVVSDIWEQIQIDENHKVFGVFANSALLSSCVLCIIPNLTRGCRSYGIIENVVTHKDHRRRGFGKAVLQHALKYAWSRNCYKVMALTGRKSESTYRFYESASFDRHAKQAFLARPETDKRSG